MTAEELVVGQRYVIEMINPRSFFCCWNRELSGLEVTFVGIKPSSGNHTIVKLKFDRKPAMEEPRRESFDEIWMTHTKKEGDLTLAMTIPILREVVVCSIPYDEIDQSDD